MPDMPHWYTHNGRAPATVPYADPTKGERQATLRDARKHGWSPGVTDVIRVLNAEGLNRWRVREAIKLTQKTLRKHPSWVTLEPDALVTEIESREDTSKRDLGTEIHADIERCVRGELYGNKSIVNAVVDALQKQWPGVRWDAETPCWGSVCDLYYGGTIDLFAPGIVVDVKTKESLGSGKLQWDEHIMQLAAYAHATGATTAANVFVDYTGDVEIILVDAEALERSLRQFALARELFYLAKRI